jgi:hypothetical protein
MIRCHFFLRSYFGVTDYENFWGLMNPGMNFVQMWRLQERWRCYRHFHIFQFLHVTTLVVHGYFEADVLVKNYNVLIGDSIRQMSLMRIPMVNDFGGIRLKDLDGFR